MVLTEVCVRPHCEITLEVTHNIYIIGKHLTPYAVTKVETTCIHTSFPEGSILAKASIESIVVMYFQNKAYGKLGIFPELSR